MLFYLFIFCLNFSAIIFLFSFLVKVQFSGSPQKLSRVDVEQVSFTSSSISYFMFTHAGGTGYYEFDNRLLNLSYILFYIYYDYAILRLSLCMNNYMLQA